jgi:large subunit ribosomal protein L3
VGASAFPSRVFKGVRMAGHMGGRSVTQRGLTVVDRDPELNLLFVKGAVPGAKNGVVVVREDV